MAENKNLYNIVLKIFSESNFYNTPLPSLVKYIKSLDEYGCLYGYQINTEDKPDSVCGSIISSIIQIFNYDKKSIQGEMNNEIYKRDIHPDFINLLVYMGKHFRSIDKGVGFRGPIWDISKISESVLRELLKAGVGNFIINEMGDNPFRFVFSDFIDIKTNYSNTNELAGIVSPKDISYKLKDPKDIKYFSYNFYDTVITTNFFSFMLMTAIGLKQFNNNHLFPFLHYKTTKNILTEINNEEIKIYSKFENVNNINLSNLNLTNKNVSFTPNTPNTSNTSNTPVIVEEEIKNIVNMYYSNNILYKKTINLIDKQSNLFKVFYDNNKDDVELTLKNKIDIINTIYLNEHLENNPNISYYDYEININKSLVIDATTPEYRIIQPDNVDNAGDIVKKSLFDIILKDTDINEFVDKISGALIYLKDSLTSDTFKSDVAIFNFNDIITNNNTKVYPVGYSIVGSVGNNINAGDLENIFMFDDKYGIQLNNEYIPICHNKRIYKFLIDLYEKYLEILGDVNNYDGKKKFYNNYNKIYIHDLISKFKIKNDDFNKNISNLETDFFDIAISKYKLFNKEVFLYMLNNTFKDTDEILKYIEDYIKYLKTKALKNILYLVKEDYISDYFYKACEIYYNLKSKINKLGSNIINHIVLYYQNDLNTDIINLIKNIYDLIKEKNLSEILNYINMFINKFDHEEIKEYFDNNYFEVLEKDNIMKKLGKTPYYPYFKSYIGEDINKRGLDLGKINKKETYDLEPNKEFFDTVVDFEIINKNVFKFLDFSNLSLLNEKMPESTIQELDYGLIKKINDLIKEYYDLLYKFYNNKEKIFYLDKNDKDDLIQIKKLTVEIKSLKDDIINKYEEIDKFDKIYVNEEVSNLNNTFIKDLLPVEITYKEYLKKDLKEFELKNYIIDPELFNKEFDNGKIEQYKKYVDYVNDEDKEKIADNLLNNPKKELTLEKDFNKDPKYENHNEEYLKYIDSNIRSYLYYRYFYTLGYYIKNNFRGYCISARGLKILNEILIKDIDANIEDLENILSISGSGKGRRQYGQYGGYRTKITIKDFNEYMSVLDNGKIIFYNIDKYTYDPNTNDDEIISKDEILIKKFGYETNFATLENHIENVFGNSINIHDKDETVLKIYDGVVKKDELFLFNNETVEEKNGWLTILNILLTNKSSVDNKSVYDHIFTLFKELYNDRYKDRYNDSKNKINKEDENTINNIFSRGLKNGLLELYKNVSSSMVFDKYNTKIKEAERDLSNSIINNLKNLDNGYKLLVEERDNYTNVYKNLKRDLDRCLYLNDNKDEYLKFLYDINIDYLNSGNTTIDLYKQKMNDTCKNHFDTNLAFKKVLEHNIKVVEDYLTSVDKIISLKNKDIMLNVLSDLNATDVNILKSYNKLKNIHKEMFVELEEEFKTNGEDIFISSFSKSIEEGLSEYMKVKFSDYNYLTKTNNGLSNVETSIVNIYMNIYKNWSNLDDEVRGFFTKYFNIMGKTKNNSGFINIEPETFERNDPSSYIDIMPVRFNLKRRYDNGNDNSILIDDLIINTPSGCNVWYYNYKDKRIERIDKEFIKPNFFKSIFNSSYNNQKLVLTYNNNTRIIDFSNVDIEETKRFSIDLRLDNEILARNYISLINRKKVLEDLTLSTKTLDEIIDVSLLPNPKHKIIYYRDMNGVYIIDDKKNKIYTRDINLSDFTKDTCLGLFKDEDNKKCGDFIINCLMSKNKDINEIKNCLRKFKDFNLFKLTYEHLSKVQPEVLIKLVDLFKIEKIKKKDPSLGKERWYIMNFMDWEETVLPRLGTEIKDIITQNDKLKEFISSIIEFINVNYTLINEDLEIGHIKMGENYDETVPNTIKERFKTEKYFIDPYFPDVERIILHDLEKSLNTFTQTYPPLEFDNRTPKNIIYGPMPNILLPISISGMGKSSYPIYNGKSTPEYTSQNHMASSMLKEYLREIINSLETRNIKIDKNGYNILANSIKSLEVKEKSIYVFYSSLFLLQKLYDYLKETNCKIPEGFTIDTERLVKNQSYLNRLKEEIDEIKSCIDDNKNYNSHECHVITNKIKEFLNKIKS